MKHIVEYRLSPKIVTEGILSAHRILIEDGTSEMASKLNYCPLDLSDSMSVKRLGNVLLFM